ncbi:hypothetical protein RMCBS344292_06716 [Rhizopus microsporus]|nr:hypothetical protein RMCBS344292_06716 [Rhizopus microsporus]
MYKASLLAIASLVLSVTAQTPVTNIIQGCVTNYDATIDYFPEKINVADDKANIFSIDYYKNYKVIQNHLNKQSYVLVQCGTPTPSNITNNTEVYQVPITKAGVMETSIVPYLEMIGAAESISLIADGNLISSPCFQKYLSSGNVTILESTNQTLQKQQIDAVQVQFGSNPYAYASTPIDPNSTVAASEAFEPDVLGRSSWISYYAAFYNLEGVANGIRQNITDNYNRLKAAAANYPKKPVVAWATYEAASKYNNNTASYTLKNDSYKIQLTRDAGAVMLNSNAVTYSSASDLLAAISSADILIDETYIGSNLTDFLKNYGIPESDSNKYNFLKRKSVYREDGILTAAGGYDWFEAPFAMADALLEDMINVVNPVAPSSDYKRHWLRNIALNEPIKYVTSANCTWSENAPRPNLATEFNGGNFSLSSESGASTIGINIISLFGISLFSLYFL